MRELPGVVLDGLLKKLTDLNDIKYAAYRTAAKIRVLQQSFYLEKLPVEVLGGVLLQHHLTLTENTVVLMPSELSNLLEDVYFVVSREHETDINIQQSVNILCRFLLQVLRAERGVELLSLKVILTILCGSKPRDKYNYLFSQLADHNNVLTARRLEIFLQRLIILTAFIGEARSFGRSLVPGTVKSCFQDVPAGSLGLSLEGFCSWLSKDPQLLVWISTLHRLHLADTGAMERFVDDSDVQNLFLCLVVHDVKCSNCKVAPTSGLRYRCLRCLNYNQCQNCFFRGVTSKSHRLNHPVQEYCYPSTAKQSLRAVLATIHNKLRRSGWKLQYLPVEPRESYLEEPTLQLEESTKNLTTSSVVPTSELENIIAELEEQSKRLHKNVDQLRSSEMKNILINHRSLVEKQVERLKTLKGQLVRQKGCRRMIESTPCIRSDRLKRTNDAISPIASNSLALTWDKYDIGIGEDEGSCILTWDDGSGSSDTCVQPVSTHAYTWLQSTDQNWRACNSDEAPIEPKTEIVDGKHSEEDIQALHDDLDGILQRLQDLLSGEGGDKTDSTKNADVVTDFLEKF